MRIRIGTRRSALALWQAHHVRDRLQALDGSLEIELVEVVTQGDKILDRPLAAVGGKGLFVKEIEESLLAGEVDLAVHSMKDLPALLPEGLVLGAVPEREDPRDALCSPAFRTLDALPKKAKVGTSSLRRACQLHALRPDLEVVSIRGNVETRLKKIETENLAAVVLALAGLKRLGLAERATEILGPPRFLPAVGQGALAIEQRRGDARITSLLQKLDHAPTRTATEAERAMLATLEGNCQVPIAAHAVIEGDSLRLVGLVGSSDGRQALRDEARGALAEAAQLGTKLGRALLDRGAASLLRPAGV